jgi:cytochrome P450
MDVASALWKRLEAEVVGWLTSPDVLRTLFNEARALAPILVVKERALVTRYDDVVEVLESDAFGVREIYADKMARTTGAFFLGMDPGPEYDRERTLARQAVRPGDLERIRSITRKTAADLVGAARAAGEMDAVGGFSRVIPTRIVQEFFGVPGPDDATLKRWMRQIFWEIFLNPSNDASVTRAAEASGQELAGYLRALIADRKSAVAKGAAGDDFLTRLVRQQADPANSFDDEGIRRNVGGVIVGALDTQSKAITLALDQLLRRPDALAAARQAARGGDDALLSACVFEALRFNPHNPILPRQCHKDHVVAAGTSHAREIAAGTLVYAGTLGAMFDPAKFTQPETFRTDRDPDDYMHFGRGMHTCFGERINGVVLPEAIKALVVLDGLRADEGPIVYDGPFPDRFMVEFDPT